MGAQPAVIVLAAGRAAVSWGRTTKLAQRLGSATVFATTLRHAVPRSCRWWWSPPRFSPTWQAPQRRRARRDRPARGGHARPGSAGHGLLDLQRRRRDSRCRRLADPARRHADGAATPCSRWRANWPITPWCSRSTRGVRAAIRSASRPSLYSELVTLRGDRGRAPPVARYPAIGVEVDDPGVLIDVDTEGRSRERAARPAGRHRTAAAAVKRPVVLSAPRMRRASRSRRVRSRGHGCRVRAGRRPFRAGSPACCRSGRGRGAGSRASAVGDDAGVRRARAVEREGQRAHRARGRAAGQPARVVHAGGHLCRSQRRSSSRSARERAMR